MILCGGAVLDRVGQLAAPLSLCTSRPVGNAPVVTTTVVSLAGGAAPGREPVNLITKDGKREATMAFDAVGHPSSCTTRELVRTADPPPHRKWDPHFHKLPGESRAHECWRNTARAPVRCPLEAVSLLKQQCTMCLQTT